MHQIWKSIIIRYSTIKEVFGILYYHCCRNTVQQLAWLVYRCAWTIQLHQVYSVVWGNKAKLHYSRWRKDKNFNFRDYCHTCLTPQWTTRSQAHAVRLQLAWHYLLSDLHLKEKTNINNITFTVHYGKQCDYIIHIAELLTATFQIPPHGKERLACTSFLHVN